jgi:thiamine-monophosphate kinase
MSSNLTPLTHGAEFDKIRKIWETLGTRAVGGGDDCAIVQLGREQLAFSTDMMVEGTHFEPGWLLPSELGWRAGAAALSDLAAVAAEPRGVLVSLGLPAASPDTFASELMDGLADVAELVGAVVWGGDLVRSDRVVIDVLVVGSATAPVLRCGAEEGDTLWVTGKLGGPATAISAWEHGEAPGGTARDRFAKPFPRVSEAMWLRDAGAKALIDLSDGLFADAGQLAVASGITCVIESARVPVCPGANEERALLGGEEYELLVVLPAEVRADVGTEFEKVFELPLTGIGHIESGSGVRVLKAGVPVKLNGGFRHFGS